MDRNLLQNNLRKACCAEAPMELMLSYNLQEEIKLICEYLGRRFNNLDIPKELESKINEIGFSEKGDFEDWFRGRINFYKNKWEEMIRYEGKIIKNYIFLSDAFKTLDKCSWWVQNAYQPYSGAKGLLNELDCIAARLEKNEANRKILQQKAKNFCREEKDWRGKNQSELDEKEREKERQIFSFFAELKAADEIQARGFQNILFLEEGENKTPDICAERDSKKYYFEVKRIQNPRDEDENLRRNKVHLGEVNISFREGLKNKIGNFICDAKEKFNKQDNNLQKEQKILILDFEPGIDARLSVNFNPTLDEIFGQNYFTELENTHNLIIWQRKYF